MPVHRLNETSLDAKRDVPLDALAAVRLLVVLAIGVGYVSTLPLGPGNPEAGQFLGYDPSWFGLQVLFFLSGMLAWRSVSHGRTGLRYMKSRAAHTLPVLALYTLAVVSVLYPALCQPGSLDADGLGRLGLYLVGTLSLVSPGGPLPGALDDAAYMCLLQGTVWTLRWGALLHLGTLLLHRLGLRSTRGLLHLGVLAVCLYAVVAKAVIVFGINGLLPFGPAFRFGYPWVFGMVCYALRDRMPDSLASWGGIAAVLMGLAGAHHEFAPWTPAIEILATSALCALCMGVLHARPRVLRHWPALALPVYLGVWPIGQTVLHAWPGISPLGLMAVTLGLAVGLAYVVARGFNGVFSPPAASQLKRPRTA